VERQHHGSVGVAADSDAVYATDAADRVTARRRSDGVSLWSNERLLNRRLSAPAVVGPTVVFGDLEGQVHFLSRSSGRSCCAAHRWLARGGDADPVGHHPAGGHRRWRAVRLPSRVTRFSDCQDCLEARHCPGRPPQRGQVDAVQPDDQEPRRHRRGLRRSDPRPPLRRRRLGSREFIVIDTGGFEPDSSTGIVKEMAKQTRQAVAEADVVIFVTDVRTGLSGQDQDIARYLRQCNKRVLLAVNKAEGMSDRLCWASSTSWAWASRIRSPPRTARASAACWRPRWRTSRGGRGGPKGRGTSPSAWRWPAAPTSASPPDQRLAGRGAPDRLRHAGHHARRHQGALERNGQKFELIDTAGLRRKGKVFEAIEKFSVVKTCRPSPTPTSWC
jgi:hypothetical protein